MIGRLLVAIIGVAFVLFAALCVPAPFGGILAFLFFVVFVFVPICGTTVGTDTPWETEL